DRAMAKLMVRRTDVGAAMTELRALGAPAIDPARLEAVLTPAAPGEAYEASKRAVTGALTELPEDLRTFVVAALARRRAARALRALLEARLDTDPAAVERAFAAAYRAMFEEQLVPLLDPTLSGDRILDRIARAVPPGVHASI